MMRADGLWVRSGGRWVLSGLSFELGRGELGAVTGPNGAGKSLLARSLAGILPLSAGKVTVDGVDIRRRKARRQVGYLPQQCGVYEYLTVEESLRFYAAVAGVSWRQRKRVCGDLLELVGLAKAGREDVARLSPGQRQRLALARTLAGDPAVLVLDEPMAGLDADGRADVRHLLAELVGMGKTILVTAGDTDGLTLHRRWQLAEGVLKGGEVA
jgi:ABC-2 type transport system ATP-binding protein